MAVAALASTGSAGATSAAQAMRNCPLPTYPGIGYFTSLTVSGTTCAEGKKVAIAYYYCRTKHGVKGTCPGGVLGFRCKVVSNSIPTEIDARVTCVYEHETVIHTYQQDVP
ncbi:MAG: hypothetical protein ABSG64_01355 [Solirubrobacteraceae bacterium]